MWDQTMSSNGETCYIKHLSTLVATSRSCSCSTALPPSHLFNYSSFTGRYSARLPDTISYSFNTSNQRWPRQILFFPLAQRLALQLIQIHWINWLKSLFVVLFASLHSFWSNVYISDLSQFGAGDSWDCGHLSLLCTWLHVIDFSLWEVQDKEACTSIVAYLDLEIMQWGQVSASCLIQLQSHV